jgi:hypothetical protein
MSSWALEPPSQPPCAGKVELRRVRRVRGDGEEEESGSRAAFCSPDSVLDDPQSRLAQGGAPSRRRPPRVPTAIEAGEPTDCVRWERSRVVWG